MVIAHNIYAINAQRQFKINTKSKAKNNEKLSSGYKINRSADDAAGLSISEKMRNQIRGLNQGLKNVEDGIGYIKTAEGALNEIHSMLARMEELAVQSANDVNTEEDRKSIDDEIQQLKEEMGTIFDRTAFNGKKIWEPDAAQISTSSEISETTSGSQLRVIDGIQIKHSEVVSHINSNNFGVIPKDGASIMVNANTEGVYFTWKGYDGNEYESNICPWKSELYGSYRIRLSDYMDYSTYPQTQGFDFEYSFDIDRHLNIQDVIDFIDGKDLVSTSRGNYRGYVLDDTGDRISGMIVDFGVTLSMDDVYGYFDFENDSKDIFDGNGITHNPLESGNMAESWQFSIHTIQYGDHLTYTPGPIPISIGTSHGGYTLGEEFKEFSPDNIKAVYEWWLNNTPNETVWANFHLGRDFPVLGNYAGAFTRIHMCVQQGDTYESLIEKAGKMNDLEFVVLGDSFDCEVENSSRVYKITVDDEQDFLMEDDNNRSLIKNFYIQHGANAGEDMLISYDCLSTEYLGINDMNVLTRDNSNQAITDIQEAVKRVSAQRSQFGAYQNRLEYVAANNANYSENLQNAESNLRDTDMAKEMLEYSKNSILEQAAQSMISQANQQNQGMLQLLQ